jgi:Tol biopolymer transport system component
MEHRFFGKNAWLIAALVGTALAAFALAPARARATTFTQITSDTTRDTDPAPSPDGKWIAFTSDRCGHGATQIYIMPADSGGEARQLTHEPDSVRAGTPSWAPDGKSILFVSTRGRRYNIYSVPFDGGNPRQLTHAPGSHRFGTYSGDGRQIAFYSNRVRPGDLYGFNIYVMDSSGETEDDMATQVTNSRGSPGHPTWSADRKWIAFVAKEYDSTRQQTMEGNILFTKYHLYKVPSRGGKEIQLTRGMVDGQAFEDTWPSWSPDGKWIAFGRQIGMKRDVWVLDVATGKAFPLTTAGNCIKPTWAFDSKSIYYSSIVTERNEDVWVARDLTLKSPAPSKSGTTKKRARSRSAAHRPATPTKK